MDALGGDPVTRGPLRYAAVAVALFLVVLALWMLALSVVVHITPDASIYLLHARTFTETLNRFTFSHDSKGIMLMFLLALPVKLLGATMAAGALAQAVAYLAGAAVIVWLLRRQMTVAVSVAALWMIAAFSPLMWGGRVRPEDFGVAFTMLALLGAYRGARWGAVLCGAMAAMGLFTKTSLVLSPLVVGVVGCLAGHRGRERAVRLVLLAAGFATVAVVVLGWIVLLDDVGQWFRQALQWPVEYKRAVGKTGLSWLNFSNLFALLHAGRLQWLFVGSVAGLCYAWRRGAGRLALFVAALLVAECVRVVIEGEPWHYVVAVMAVPMVVGTSLFGLGRDGRMNWCGVGVVVILLSPVFVVALPDAARATRLRLVQDGMTPLEALAESMAPHYRPGEQIMVGGQDYQVLLHLNAPRPYPILPLHLHAVSEDEQAAAEQHFRATPPEWIIDSRPLTSPVPFRLVGHPDQLTYVYISPDESEVEKPRDGIRIGARYPTRRLATDLPGKLLREYPYHLVADTGLHQAWRLTVGGVRNPQQSQN
ncbi:MAG: hypothetical protein ISS31_06315 [Kiritimatiellae bacterium]|nr:hypothetical protein [Kiritimatiellia bacterium]